MIRGSGFRHEMFKFPCGEMQVKILATNTEKVSIHFNFERTEEVFELLLVCDALKEYGLKLTHIDMPYVPFGRQDRAQPGEAFSLKIFTTILNLCNAKAVDIVDPHSDVTPALINNCKVREQYQVFEHLFEGKKNFQLISPDGGALKKIYKLARRVACKGVIECSKQRDVNTGVISGVRINASLEAILGQDCYIVDDICDGGRTFIEIAKALRVKGAKKVVLMVSHCFMTKGIEVFAGLIHEIYTREGRVK